MVDNYNALINAPESGKKRKISEISSSQNDALSKTLKEQVFILTKVQDNLLEFIREKLGATDEEISKIREIGDINIVPVKRNPRENPGIFTDDEKRKYYINIHGAFVYKRPCGKPRKEKMWCHALGEWVDPGSEISEEVANTMAPDVEEDNDGNEPLPNNSTQHQDYGEQLVVNNHSGNEDYADDSSSSDEED